MIHIHVGTGRQTSDISKAHVATAASTLWRPGRPGLLFFRPFGVGASALLLSGLSRRLYSFAPAKLGLRLPAACAGWMSDSGLLISRLAFLGLLIRFLKWLGVSWVAGFVLDWAIGRCTFASLMGRALAVGPMALGFACAWTAEAAVPTWAVLAAASLARMRRPSHAVFAEIRIVRGYYRLCRFP